MASGKECREAADSSRTDEGERSIFERDLRIKKLRKPRKMWIYLDKQQGNRYNST